MKNPQLGFSTYYVGEVVYVYNEVDKVYKYCDSGMDGEFNFVSCLKSVLRKFTKSGVVHIEHNPLDDVKLYVTKRGRGVDIIIYVTGKRIEIEVKNISPKTGQSIKWCDGEIKRRFTPDADRKYAFISCYQGIAKTAKSNLMQNGIIQVYAGNYKMTSRYDNTARYNIYTNPEFLILIKYIKNLLIITKSNPIVYDSMSRYYVPYIYTDLFTYFSVNDIIPNTKLKE